LISLVFDEKAKKATLYFLKPGFYFFFLRKRINMRLGFLGVICSKSKAQKESLRFVFQILQILQIPLRNDDDHRKVQD
jgi:hypothetical protein